MGRTLYETAVHEAGHAVVCYAQGRQFERVWVREYGSNAPCGALEGFLPTNLGTTRQERTNASVLLAGVAAEILEHEWPVSVQQVEEEGGWSSDYIKAVARAMLRTRGAEDFKDWLWDAECEARALLKKHWPKVTSLADILVARREVSFDECIEIMRGKQRRQSSQPVQMALF